MRLWERDGQNQMELTQSAGLKQPTVVRILDRMERDNLVKRIRNKKDKRVYNFYLTKKAKKAYQKLEAQGKIMQRIATKNFAKNSILELNRQISNIIVNLELFIEENQC